MPIPASMQEPAAPAHWPFTTLIGLPRTSDTIPTQTGELLNRKEFHITGSWMSYSAPFPGREWEMVADYATAGRFVFDPQLVFRKFPLSRAAEAFGLFRNPSQVHGKVMLMCGDDA